MGVPLFYGRFLAQIKKTHPRYNVLQSYIPNYVSSFSFDLNGMLHPVAQKTFVYNINWDKLWTEEKEILEKRLEYVKKAPMADLEADLKFTLTSKMTQVIEQVNPRDTLCIAIDGVAPQAKVFQQRQRRYRSALESKNTIFDSNSLSPYTPIMEKINQHLEQWIQLNQSTLPAKVIYSSFKVPGEGEHNIMDYIRDGSIQGKGAHIIYGLDADLVMLSLLAPLDQIYLMREDVEDIINIDQLRLYLREEMKTVTALDDFVVMMYLVGNDFLPASPALSDLPEALEKMMEVYQKLVASGNFTGFTNPEKVEILYPELNRFLTELATYETVLLQKLAENSPLVPLEAMDRAFVYKNGRKEFDLDVFRQGWYNRALVPRTQLNIPVLGVRSDPSLYSFTLDDVADLTERYLTGMQWIYRYYRLGAAQVNQAFIFPYFFAPLLLDLSDYLTLADVDFHAPPEDIQSDPKYHFSGLEQLLSILPLKSRGLIPPEAQKLLEMNSPIVDLYPTGITIDKQGIRSAHHGVVLIPFIDVTRMHLAVATLNLPEVYLEQYDPKSVQIFVRKVVASGYRGGNRGGEMCGRGSSRGTSRGESRGSYRSREGEGREGESRGSYRGTRGEMRGSYRGNGGGETRVSYRGTGRGEMRGSYRGNGGEETRGSYRGSGIPRGTSIPL